MWLHLCTAMHVHTHINNTLTYIKHTYKGYKEDLCSGKTHKWVKPKQRRTKESGKVDEPPAKAHRGSCWRHHAPEKPRPLVLWDLKPFDVLIWVFSCERYLIYCVLQTLAILYSKCNNSNSNTAWEQITCLKYSTKSINILGNVASRASLSSLLVAKLELNVTALMAVNVQFWNHICSKSVYESALLPRGWQAREASWTGLLRALICSLMLYCLPLTSVAYPDRQKCPVQNMMHLNPFRHALLMLLCITLWADSFIL